MGFLSKVKNIFFEEEIIEVEDEPKKAKKEEPVAKKIELPKVEKVRVEDEEVDYTLEDEQEVDLSDMPEEKENKFPMDFDEEDFREEQISEEEVVYQEPAISRRSERRKTPVYDYEEPKVEEVFEEEQQEESAPKYDFEMEYGKEKEKDSETHGLYEGKSAKKAFTPTPIISPIYGILDKNYKKDDVVTKKEIRLSSAPKKIDLDTVREKAYGDLTSDISQSMEEVREEKKYEEVVDLAEEDDLLYDLNDTKPAAVKEVTVGDAEEYFNELGLEYNIDYKDSSVENSKNSKEKTRRSVEEVEPTDIEADDVAEEETEDSEEGLESNLFDLIESMYDEKE